MKKNFFLPAGFVCRQVDKAKQFMYITFRCEHVKPSCQQGKYEIFYRFQSDPAAALFSAALFPFVFFTAGRKIFTALDRYRNQVMSCKVISILR